MEKISYEVIKSVIGTENDVSKFVWAGLEIEVKRFLTMEEMFDFTNTVFETCFRQADSSYRPEVKDFIVRSCILDFYTNVEVPDDLKDRYDMVYRYGVIPEVMEYIDQTQFNAIMAAIDCKIEDKLNTNVERIERDIAEVDRIIDEVKVQFNGIFDGIDNETIRQVAAAIANMNIDPAVLAKSVVEARGEADKSNMRETAK